MQPKPVKNLSQFAFAPPETAENAFYRASNPETSAWVSANAGAGKTYLLTGRVLRLLLSGSAPGRILCITYTNAAAAEMQARIHKELAKWVMMEEEKLTDALTTLTGHIPGKTLLTKARALFAQVLDAPEGIRIQTIHSFCQSLLKRFPLEAGTEPYFTVIDERTSQELLREAVQHLFLKQQREPVDTPLSQSLNLLAARMSETSFRTLLAEIIKKRGASQAPADLLKKQLYHALELPLHVTYEALLEEHFHYTENEISSLMHLAAKLREDNKTAEHGEILHTWCTDASCRNVLIARYLYVHLTKELKPRSFRIKLPDSLKMLLLAEQERVLQYHAKYKALATAEMSLAVATVAEAVQTIYDTLKRQRAAHDYDDLIALSRALMQKPGIAPWVLYKLDGGLDHILLDEAQDTSPAQWEIVKTLADEFFYGLSARADTTRTLFVVGDEKQSIYSFQGADATGFARMRSYFSERIRNAGQAFAEVELLKSYRSAEPVLQMVDAVFDTQHVLERRGHAGRVELWPLLKAEDTEDLPPWQLPLENKQKNDPVRRLAQTLAATIAQWLIEKRALPSENRSITPGDIMILVRKRGPLVDALVRELKRKNVPVAGADRMVLANNLAVRDMLALANFLLLPEDDLNLAALLRSPLFNVSEEELFQLAYNRAAESLWQRLHGHAAYAYLRTLLGKADFISPHTLFMQVLEAEGGRRKIAGRMGSEYNDPLDELLLQALQYERTHTPSLQGFLQWMGEGNATIKRDLEHGRNEVRILTVHAAKGLEAPIVFLPDTVQTKTRKDKLLWHAGEEGALALWTSAAKQDPELTATARTLRDQAEEAEYRRLLYVALTRARDELYICGIEPRKTNSKQQSWYALIAEKFPAIAQSGDTPLGVGYVLFTPQATVIQAEKTKVEAVAMPPLPAYFSVPAAFEEPPSHPLMPSHLSEKEALPVFSPLTENTLFSRGTLMHKLLQRLPEVPLEARPAAAEALLKRESDLSQTDRTSIQTEIFAVLNHPEWSHLFQPGALAEVPITGRVTFDGKTIPIAGQIDRLVITGEELWLLDYKTHRLPPKKIDRVPLIYLRQMAAYRALLAQIYPEKTICSAFLWTSAPLLMEIPREKLPF